MQELARNAKEMTDRATPGVDNFYNKEEYEKRKEKLKTDLNLTN